MVAQKAAPAADHFQLAFSPHQHGKITSCGKLSTVWKFYQFLCYHLLMLPLCERLIHIHSVVKWKNSQQKNISSNQLFSIFFSKTFVSRNFCQKKSGSTVWKFRKFSLIHFWQKFRESTVFTKEFTKELISRNIFSVRDNFAFFQTVRSKSNFTEKIFREINSLGTSFV